MLKNQDPSQFQTLAQIRAAFATFGTIVSVSVLSPRLTVEVEFTSLVAAEAVLKQDGKVVGGQRLSVYQSPVPEEYMPHKKHARAWSLPHMFGATHDAMDICDDGLNGPAGQDVPEPLPSFDPFGGSTDTALMQAWRRRVNTPLDGFDAAPTPIVTRTALRGDCKEFTPQFAVTQTQAPNMPTNQAD